MYSIALRELRFYFSNLSGYIVLTSYLTLNTLLFWFFDTPYQLLNSDFGDLSPFFWINPWLFFFLIPALSMRSFSQERATGTIEILLTKPLKPFDIYKGKFIGIALVLLIIFTPTLFNVLALNALLESQSNLDLGKIFSSYIGLFFLGILFLALSICCSLMFKNQVTSFITSAIGCCAQFYFFDFIADFLSNPYIYEIIKNLGAESHYINFTLGIMHLEDLIYFIGLSVVYFLISIELIKKEQN